MKLCNNCNTAMNDNDIFCPNCGSNVPAAYRPVTKESVSVGGWIGRSLIPYIPFVGGLIYLIMLFIWCGDSTKEDTFRNWAKAQLIVMAIVVVLSVIIGIVFGVIMASAYSYY